MEIILLRRRRRWLGYVLCKPSDDMTKVAIKMIPERKGKRDRPKTTRRRTVKNKIKERGYTCGALEKIA